MYNARTLKPHILLSETQVECPVKGCSQKVTRQRRFFRTAPQFQCPEHRIYISPSTFEYPTKLDNLLWQDRQDVLLLENIMRNKRESRMARDNSEDALSWNVFRYLDKEGYLSMILSYIIGRDLGKLQLVYWSYSSSFQSVWPDLAAARREFGEQPQRSSEPDLIAFSNKAVLFIEAKLTASNKAKPGNLENKKKYLTGGNGWYQQVFMSDYTEIANNAKMYELLRFWLLGSWIAAQSGRDFYLVNVTRSEYEQDIEERFGHHIKANVQRCFMRVTWEGLYERIAEKIPPSVERDLLLDYLKYKTVGYNQSRELQRAFSIPLEPNNTVT
jgi:hypothetical protein